METGGRIARLIEAFAADGYDVDRQTGVQVHEGNIGIAAFGHSGSRKKAFYLEGSPYRMGYLMGSLAEPDISRMCEEFNKRVVFDFLDIHLPKELEEILGELLKIPLLAIEVEFPKQRATKLLDHGHRLEAP